MNKSHTSKYFIYLGILSLLSASLLMCSCTISTLPDRKSSIVKSKKDINEELYNSIMEYSVQHRIEPVDAKIDRVWKAIPGYNGKEVDVEVTYKNMEKVGEFDETKIIYKEISPKIHLEDLEPKPIYKGNPQKPMVALLINVAWGNEFIPKIINTLNKNNTKATFFFDGSWVNKNPDIAKSIYKAGHEIGNHAYSHPDLKGYSEKQTIEELEMTNNIIGQTIGIKPKWFAPPSGSYNDTAVIVADRLSMKTILWTVDTVDWKKPDTQSMVAKVIREVEKGSMILMHPTKPTAEGLDTMIARIKEKGLHLGTVSDLMDEKRID